jgi:hypothetical protein
MNITKILKVKEFNKNNKGVAFLVLLIPLALTLIGGGYIYLTNQKAIDTSIEVIKTILWNVITILSWVLLNLPMVLMLSEFVIIVITVTSSRGSVPGLVITFVSLNWKLFRAILDLMIDIGTFLIRAAIAISGAATKLFNPAAAV